MKKLPRAVVALGVVSLLNDAASEMIYPLLPAFVAALGSGPAMLGLIEGLADATASLLKLVSGTLADRFGRQKGFALLGYGMANLLRPLLGLASSAWQVLGIRLGDRVGKGLRTTPRDALLAQAAPKELRGRAFGFHRAMDHTGAFLGPLVAMALLSVGFSVRSLFLCSVVPGALCLFVLAVFVPRGTTPGDGAIRIGIAPSGPYRRLLAAIAIFALGNSSDAFLLWRAHELGIAPRFLPLLWSVLHLSKALFSVWGGALSDRIGRRRPILLGWLVYALVYFGFGMARSRWEVWALFVVYGSYFGLTEGAEKAFVVDLVPEDWRGRALGAYHATVGFAALPASVVFGAVYKQAGAFAAFGMGALLAVLAALVLPQPLRERGQRAS